MNSPHRALGLRTQAFAVATAAAIGLVAGAAPAAAGTACAPTVIAHRGDSSRAPENTMPAFRSALRVGAGTIETDVQFTADGVPVLMHDPIIDRTTDGTGPVSALTLAQVRGLDAGSWFHRRWAGTRVPTMAAMLALAYGHHARVQLELKVRPTTEQLATFLGQLRQVSMGPSVVVNSFDQQTVLDVRAAAPDIATALIDYKGFRDPGSVLRFGTTYIVNQAAVTRSRVQAWADAGIAVRPWVVDSVSGWKRMAYDHATATITDRPTAYLAWARSYCR